MGNCAAGGPTARAHVRPRSSRRARCSLEHNIEDITGSIKRQSAQTITSAPPAAAVPVISAAGHDRGQANRKAGPAPVEAAAPPAVAPEQAAAPAHEPVPLPPVRVAALPAEATASKPEFGVALASSSNLDVLHLQWGALKANYGPLLAGLRPDRGARAARHRNLLPAGARAAAERRRRGKAVCPPDCGARRGVPRGKIHRRPFVGSICRGSGAAA